MNLEEKLWQLKQAAKTRSRDTELERQLEYLRRLERPARPLPAQRAPQRIEEYVDGQVEKNAYGEFFLARQALPFGRPYGKLRISDLASADLSPLNLWLEDVVLPPTSELVYLDTETTGLAGGTGTCAFLIGLGAVEGSKFVIRQYFLRDYPEEKAALVAVAEALQGYRGVVTFNGKTFDLPLLETRYALARLKSPFSRLVHLDALHPSRRLWKLRLETCELTRLEQEVLGVSREGDVPGSEIPQIYFDYLRTGSAQALQPVFYHNALDIVSLAGLTVELARALSDAGTLASSLDLFSLSRIFQRAHATERSLATCKQALDKGLPQLVETQALWQLAAQHKRQRQHDLAVGLWNELARREAPFAIQALEELAIYYEHRQRDVTAALKFTSTAITRLREQAGNPTHLKRFAHRLERLQRKSGL